MAVGISLGMLHMPVRKFIFIQTALRLFSYTNFVVNAQGLAAPTWQNLLTQTGILPSAFLLRFEPFSRVLRPMRHTNKKNHLTVVSLFVVDAQGLEPWTH